MMLWQPFYLQFWVTHTLPHHEMEHQQSVNYIWNCILGNEGFAQIHELITVLFTVFIATHSIYNRKNMNCQILNITESQTFKQRLLAVEYQIWIVYYYPSANTTILYKDTDGSVGQPHKNLSNSTEIGDIHRTVLELTVSTYRKPRVPSCQRFNSDQDPNRKSLSGTVANTDWQRIQLSQWIL
jgi:hypothetical protein